MRSWNWDRLAAGSGILFVALLIVAFAITGDPPGVNAKPGKIAEFVLDHSKELKASAILGGLAAITLFWFAGALASRLRAAGEQRLAGTTVAAGATLAGVIIAMMTVQAAIVRIANGSPDTLKSWWDFGFTMQTLISFPAVALMTAVTVGAWRAKLLPQWWCGLSALGAIWVLVSGGALAAKGFYSPDGGMGWIAFIIFMVWSLGTSGYFAFPREAAPRATAVPAA